jgi:N-acetylglutamate synthase-like GNAT family acetyltransferase
MSRYVIRPPGKSEEWLQVRRLLTDYRQEFNDDPCFTSFEEELRDIEALYSKPGKAKLVAVDESDGTVMGCVALRMLSLDVAEMKRLYVAPAYRGRGIGRNLVEAILAKAREIGFQRMVLDTSFAMKAAISLYLGLGFTPIEPYNAQDTATVLCLGIDLQPAEH